MSLKRRMTPHTVVRGAGRVALAIVAAGVVGLCGLQYEEIAAKNVTLARDVSSSRARSVALAERIEDQERAIARLTAPGGAIPEIHDELQLVTGREEVIVIRGAVPATPEPDWTAP